MTASDSIPRPNLSGVRLLFVHKGGPHDPGLQAVLRWLPRIVPTLRQLIIPDQDRGKRSTDTTTPLPCVLEALRSFAPTHIITWVPLFNEAELQTCEAMGARVGAVANSFVSLSSGIFRDQVRFFDLLRRCQGYFVTHGHHVPILRRHGINAVHAPFFYDHDIYHPTRRWWRAWPLYDYPVMFLGSVMEPGVENRVELLRIVAQHFPVYVVTYQRPDIPGVRWLGVANSERLINRLINRSVVVLGTDFVTPRQLDEFNHRMENVIEPYQDRFTLRGRVSNTLGAGGCYAVERHDEMLEYAGGEEGGLFWNDPDEAVARIGAALADREFRSRVAARAWEQARRRHTAEVRIWDMLTVMTGPAGKPVRS